MVFKQTIVFVVNKLLYIVAYSLLMVEQEAPLGHLVTTGIFLVLVVLDRNRLTTLYSQNMLHADLMTDRKSNNPESVVGEDNRIIESNFSVYIVMQIFNMALFWVILLVGLVTQLG